MCFVLFFSKTATVCFEKNKIQVIIQPHKTIKSLCAAPCCMLIKVLNKLTDNVLVMIKINWHLYHPLSAGGTAAPSATPSCSTIQHTMNLF